MKDHISLSFYYPHPPAKVWKSLTTSDAIAQWLMPNTFRLELGAEFTFQAPKQPFFDGRVNCKVLSIVHERELSYSWQGGPMPKPTVVTYVLEPEGQGTRLHFTHTGFQGFFSKFLVRRILENGWKDILGKRIVPFVES